MSGLWFLSASTLDDLNLGHTLTTILDFILSEQNL